MDNLFSIVSGILVEDYKLVVHSQVTQNLIGSSNSILWTEGPSKISQDVYDKFKDALKRRGNKFYMSNNNLPYQDFCIALLSCNSYSLSHISTANIPARTYTAAWRAIDTISSTGLPEVKEWIKPYMLGRTALGYSIIHNVTLDNSTSPVRERTLSNMSLHLTTDKDIIEEALSSKSVEVIKYYDTSNCDIGIFRTTNTPESQLSNLIIVHEARHIAN